LAKPEFFRRRRQRVHKFLAALFSTYLANQICLRTFLHHYAQFGTQKVSRNDAMDRWIIDITARTDCYFLYQISLVEVFFSSVQVSYYKGSYYLLYCRRSQFKLLIILLKRSHLLKTFCSMNDLFLLQA